MELYLIWQDENNNYDTYDSAMVAADSPEDAVLTHPGGYVWKGRSWQQETADGTWVDGYGNGSWTSVPALVRVEHIGTAKEGTESGVICASFNAG